MFAGCLVVAIFRRPPTGTWNFRCGLCQRRRSKQKWVERERLCSFLTGEFLVVVTHRLERSTILRSVQLQQYQDPSWHLVWCKQAPIISRSICAWILDLCKHIVDLLSNKEIFCYETMFIPSAGPSLGQEGPSWSHPQSKRPSGTFSQIPWIYCQVDQAGSNKKQLVTFCKLGLERPTRHPEDASRHSMTNSSLPTNLVMKGFS